MAKAINENTLFYGDNLPILREYFPDECVDLIYLDPPFNSNRSYNVLFKDESGINSDAQLNVFDDTWHWGKIAEQTYYDITTNAPLRVAQLVDSFRQFIGTNQMMAYLVMMTARLVELHRVLKPTGSLYLHCDPTASHYLKIVLDTIFGANNFRNEIIWSYKRYTASSNRFQRLHDVLILYGKTEQVIFNDLREDYGDKSGIADSHYKQDENGKWFRWQKRRGQEPYKIYLSEGRRMGDVWEIPIINASSKERLGYPTQKPLALLERIIQASSNPGDIALDPFCGCGTAVAASEKLGRRWIGIDVTHLAISLIKYRMKDMFPSCQYSVIGEPEDLGSAHQLARDDRYQFQWWALSLVRARPIGGEAGNKRGKMGSDRGIDGEINFFEGLNKPSGWVIVQVKSGHVKVGDVRDLRGAVEREGAAIGVLITLEAPTSEMIKEVAVAGNYTSGFWERNFPRLQILTIEELLSGKSVEMPTERGTFRQAEKVKKEIGKQEKLGL